MLADTSHAGHAATLQRLLDAVPLLVVSCDANLRYTYANPAYAARFGKLPADLVGRRMPDVVGPEVFAEIQPFVDRVLNGECVDVEATVTYANVGAQTFRTALTPIRDDAGAVVGWDGIGENITERRRQEQTLRAADKKKDEFLGILAHELRNPLAPMTFAIASLEREFDPSRRQALDVMTRQVQRLSRLVDDLLDVSRIAQGRVELRRERVALAPLLRHAVETAIAADAERHTIELNIVDDADVIGDAQRLGQIFDNLLGNAVKYTPDRGLIVARLTRTESEALISVRDSGTGIAPDALPRIFDLFMQSERSVDRSQGGLGIGLTLVDRLTRLHGGSVAVSSAGVNQGAEFLVRLPLA